MACPSLSLWKHVPTPFVLSTPLPEHLCIDQLWRWAHAQNRWCPQYIASGRAQRAGRSVRTSVDDRMLAKRCVGKASPQDRCVSFVSTVACTLRFDQMLRSPKLSGCQSPSEARTPGVRQLSRGLKVPTSVRPPCDVCWQESNVEGNVIDFM